jgi:glycosyltransferase involved in cell wall biosynthesis
VSLGGPAQSRLRVLRICHAGRNPAHRARDRALLAAGVDVVYVVPRIWPEAGGEGALSAEGFPIIEVDVRSPGDVNRHSYADVGAVSRLAVDHQVDLVDLFEEPFSRAAGQLLPRLPPELPVVMYSAQNLDKRWPPPYRNYERRSFQRVCGFYPCSRQAAAVLRRKGFGGLVEPLPLGYEDELYSCGEQSLAGGRLRLALVGRMVHEKGVCDAVRVLADLYLGKGMDAELVLAGSGPELTAAMVLAKELGVSDRVEHRPWLATPQLAQLYRETHVVLAPSRSTATWAEQFGRMIVEGQASGCVIVGYDSGAIPEVGGDPALLVRERDVDSLAQAAALVLSDPEEFQARRRSGLALAAERTWTLVARKQANLYRMVLEAGSTPLLPGSPRARRRLAEAEFGRPAEALGQSRPFALPYLRRPSATSRVLGLTMDMVAEVRTKIGRGDVHSVRDDRLVDSEQ